MGYLLGDAADGSAGMPPLNAARRRSRPGRRPVDEASDPRVAAMQGRRCPAGRRGTWHARCLVGVGCAGHARDQGRGLRAGCSVDRAGVTPAMLPGGAGQRTADALRRLVDQQGLVRP